MQGLDISNNNDVDLNNIDFDFVICKATEGNYFTDWKCDGWVQQAKARGKLWGVYHYITGNDGEIDYFIDAIQGYIGEGLICLDWEQGSNSRWGDEGYLESCVNRVKERTGIPPVIYAPQGSYPWDLASRCDCGTWVAQYPNYDSTGYQDAPWNEGAYSCVIRQYASTGYLDGYGPFDLDKAYVDADTWQRYANPNGGTVSADRSVNVRLWESNGSDAQKFSVTWDGDYATLTNVASGLCLDVYAAGTTDGTNVQVFTPNGTDAQKWKIINAPGDYRPNNATPVEFVPKVNESMRLDADACGTDWNTNVQIWSANDSDAQKWTIVDHGDGTWTIVNNHAMLPLDVVNGGN